MSLHAVSLTREGETFLFLSIDGEKYLEVNLPRLMPKLDGQDVTEIETQVRNLINGGKTRPLTYARRWFTLIAPHEDKTTDVVLYRQENGEWVVEQDVKFQGELAARAHPLQRRRS